MHFTRVGTSMLCALFLAACGSNGILGLSPKPDGNIVISNPIDGTTIQSTLTNPMAVSGGSFAIGITENYFSGPYNVTVTAWTAPFNIPCFVPHYVDSALKTNVIKFTADNATPVSDPAQLSPCNHFVRNGVLQSDEETVRITDNDGHAVNFFYREN